MRLTRMLGVAGLALLACDDNPFDSAQVPTITIVPVIAAPLVVFSWSPAGAQAVRVYKGTVATGQSDQVVWSVTATGTNTLVSGLEYGTTNPAGGAVDVAAKALVAGQPYTVQISRTDPKGGSGGTGAIARYQNTQTFTLAAIVIPP